ncbi:mediator of DNA damage checkpoint protein 1-like [Acanthaster planci]|uniref:Mediator of DNA damage checkpoint protein 1-like n=1 Tax=Acanthaster planci TaxID=133434 RepID=A0A8B7Y9L9_ACAPL|nr:mediator of DNA damage checkpoint protein 1-like [Acanthaster planci]
MPPQMVTVGDSAEFFCLATSVPPSNRYRWFVGRGQSMTRVSKTKGRFVIANQGASLRILNITREDSGMPVRCVARNPLDMKGMDEDMLQVLIQRDPIPTTTIAPTKPPRTTTKSPPTPSPTTLPLTVLLKTSQRIRLQTLRAQATKAPSLAPPEQPTLRTASKQQPLTQSPEPKNPVTTVLVTTNKMDEPVSASPPLQDVTIPHVPPDSVLQPGPKGKGFTAGAAVGFTVLVLIVLALTGILIKIKFVDKHEKPVKRKTLRPANKPRIDKLDIVVVPNATPEEDGNTNNAQPSNNTDATPKPARSARRQSFVHPDFLEQLASTIRSKSHCSSMFKRGSFSWRKRKASTLDRPHTVKSEDPALDTEATSTVKRYSAFFNAVPQLSSDEMPVATARQVQKTESVYENTEIGLRLQQQVNRRSRDRESPYENTQCPMRDAAPLSDPDRRKSEASSLLDLVYADLDWTGFSSNQDEVNDTEEKTEYAAIRTSKVLS